jgi:hypothetical protein
MAATRNQVTPRNLVSPKIRNRVSRRTHIMNGCDGIVERRDLSRLYKSFGIVERCDKSRLYKSFGIVERRDKSRLYKSFGIVERRDKSRLYKSFSIRMPPDLISDKKPGFS